MRQHADDLERNLNDNIKRLAAVITQTIVSRTPVDTGRARGNWEITVGGAPPTVERSDAFDPSGSATIAAAQSKIQGRKPGQTLYLTNNVKYIGRLNDGSSAQAPEGFVEQAISAGEEAFRNLKIIRK